MSFPGKGKTQSQTTSGTSSMTGSTRTYAPDWVDAGSKDIAEKIKALMGQDPQTFTPGADPLQTQASANATNLSGTPWNYSAAADVAKGVATADAPQTQYFDSSKLIDKFANPYTEQVVAPTEAALDRQAGQARAQQALDLTKSGAFGGSGVALAIPELEARLAETKGVTLGNLRSAGFNTALQAAQSEAARRQAAADTNASLMQQGRGLNLSAATGLAGIADSFANTQRGNIATQSGVGAQNRDIATEQARSPLDLISWATQNYPSIVNPYFGSDTTGTTTSNSTSTGKVKDPMGDLAKAAQIAALFAA